VRPAGGLFENLADLSVADDSINAVAAAPVPLNVLGIR
jgi:hypothetical protein